MVVLPGVDVSADPSGNDAHNLQSLVTESVRHTFQNSGTQESSFFDDLSYVISGNTNDRTWICKKSKFTRATPPCVLNFRELDSSAPQVQSLVAGSSSQFKVDDLSCDNHSYDFYDDISYIISNNPNPRT